MLQSPLLNEYTNCLHFFGEKNDSNPNTNKYVFSVHQVHSSKIITVTKDSSKTENKEADGLLSFENVALYVKTADCIPVLFYDFSKQSIASVHAGWRGLHLEILSKLVKKMSKGSSVKNILAVVGPHIGSCCYSVSEDRIKKFSSYIKKDKNIAIKRNNQIFLNLGKIACLQLAKSGILVKHIDSLKFCTSCDHRFSSYRRDGPDAARMINYIQLV